MLPALNVGAIAGNSRPVISLAMAAGVLATAIDPADAEAGIQLESDGDYVEHKHTGDTDTGDWITPKAAAGVEYECRVTVNTGTLSGGTSGSWLPLNVTRLWFVTQTIIGTKQANITLEIRQAAGGAVLASATFNLTADVV